MNKYLQNLNKIEFVLTYACTGKCRHCSEGERLSCTERIDPDAAADAVCKIAKEYDIKTVLAFGGEPLLHIDALVSVISAAKACGIPKRQVITNGYFSTDAEKIKDTAKRLFECGVNDLLLSVDAFHQETIPLNTVEIFAREAKNEGLSIRLSPAWLVSRENDNKYNKETKEIIESLGHLKIPCAEGNVVFPEGNAIKFLSEYFVNNVAPNPYAEDPCNVKCISFSPNGDVLDGILYEKDIMDIIRNYTPQEREK